MRKRNLVLATVIGLVASIACLAPASSAVAQPGPRTTLHSIENLAASTPVGSQSRVYAGTCYQSRTTYACYPIFKTTYTGCSHYKIGPVTVITECIHGVVYSVPGLYVWGSTGTAAGLTGSKLCHAPGSRSTGFSYTVTSCGEHRETLRYDKIWDAGQITQVGGMNSGVLALHINCYDTGICFGPYGGLG